MKKYGLLSVLIFLVSSLIYVVSMFNVSGVAVLSGPMMILLVMILPFVGILVAFKAKGGLKAAGIIGNSLLFFISAVIPFASTLFWNQP
ncbi:hypothetical protein [Peribacillus acanthi]|uniref:hypothetical protein n=1 Tax=Peribacillus acanthi TaxID=2171554 RepID=UPI000D3E432C|nr:hypothetical protein [Peribacillus acanthi]